MHRIEETIKRGMCIGCGVCSVATHGAIKIGLGLPGIYQADITESTNDELRTASRVCPFSDESMNEDVLGAPHLDDSIPKHNSLGQVTKTFAGRVDDDEYLKQSSSGGLTSWTIEKLIEAGIADAVIKVGRTNDRDNDLFEYAQTNLEQVSESRKSYYYASTMVDVLKLIEDDDRKFILVGVPCFIRAARLLCIERPEYSPKLVFFIGLVCGHYKTHQFAESLAWQVGVHPNDIEEVDFRMKDFEKPASEYSFGVRSRGSENWVTRKTRDLVGGGWGYNAFQPEACNFCDDVVGETSDVSFGDAWLPEFVQNGKGTNVVISRNPVVDQILGEGVEKGSIKLEEISKEQAELSQAGGFRHRREGLSVRLADDLAKGLSVPVKRVIPNRKAVPLLRRQLIRRRRAMAELSHNLFLEAKSRDNLQIYLDGMQREIDKYNNLDALSIKKTVIKVRNFCIRKFGKLSERLMKS
ncbi:Coenzyme F420 hydrogenase/dehydrogenase, beta subunit C-terminal domain [Corynebacterium glutamicum]|uniref:Coenzyme F420 hydrogenase/dehydrogenase, beta subunit C-terminal domain n=1 Tax=Corynebacterium glutamicum TaxID=1718 RepID=UPI000744CE46|nr:Coenzyme F420 hydrogenase/dehydrogenase, beta subunit C-terminal domain [Corynebacterium glutamicum]ALZ99142.1 hypothetical protein APT58_02245 [Corynebacterium glutamicum]